MLAYVFWHVPAPGDWGAYEDALVEFHRSLAASPPAGFHRSASFRVEGLPWVGDYEDWYLVEDWAALGTINQAAVADPHRPAHDAAAQSSVAGAGGVYQLLGDPVDPAAIRSAAWFHKPLGATYADFTARMRTLAAEADGCLWQRQLVLGPGREFCVWGGREVAGEGALTCSPGLVFPSG